MRHLSSTLLVLALLAAGCDAVGPQSSAARVSYAVDGAARVSYTDADGSTQTATPDAAWRLDVDAPSGRTVVLTAASATGAPVTATISLNDALVASKRGRSVRVESSSSSSSSGYEVEVYGPVEALGADRVTVGGLVFIVDSSTRLYDRDNQTVPLATFAVGTYVEAEGRPNSDGTYRAKKIKLEDEDDDGGQGAGEIEVNGTIQAIDAESMSVAGRRFVTGPSTRYQNDDGDPISRDAFQVGYLVEAEGSVQTDGSVRADKIKLDDD